MSKIILSGTIDILVAKNRLNKTKPVTGKIKVMPMFVLQKTLLRQIFME